MHPRVVLADDHVAVAEELRLLLTAECDVTEVVRDGQALVDAVRSSMPDVIVSDIAMPVMNGLSAARTILSEYPDARIVLITVLTDAELISHALSTGVLGYVLKSDAGEELLAAVRAARHGQLYVSTGAEGLLKAARNVARDSE